MRTDDQNNTSSARCAPDQLEMPVVTIDMPMTTQTLGTLFFMKIDIEGAEYETTLGANSILSNEAERPCFLMVELKNRPDMPTYEQAFPF